MFLFYCDDNRFHLSASLTEVCFFGHFDFEFSVFISLSVFVIQKVIDKTILTEFCHQYLSG